MTTERVKENLAIFGVGSLPFWAFLLAESNLPPYLLGIVLPLVASSWGYLCHKTLNS